MSQLSPPGQVTRLTSVSSAQSTIITTSLTTISLDALIHARRKKPVRSHNAIVRAILEACRTPTVQHWIMVRARLGYETFWHHMSDLISRGMMDTIHDGSKTLYKINERGLELLDKMDSL